jgi:hypothetical protein
MSRTASTLSLLSGASAGSLGQYALRGADELDVLSLRTGSIVSPTGSSVSPNVGTFVHEPTITPREIKTKRKSELLDPREAHDSKRRISDSSLLQGAAVAVATNDAQWPAGAHKARRAHDAHGASGSRSGGSSNSSSSSSSGGTSNTYTNTHTPSYSWPELASWALCVGVPAHILQDSAQRRAKTLPKAHCHSADDTVATQARSQPMVRRASYPDLEQHSVNLLSSVANSGEPAVGSVAALLSIVSGPASPSGH